VPFNAAVKVPYPTHPLQTGCYCHNQSLKDSGTAALYGRSEIYILTNTKGADIELRPSIPALTDLCYGFFKISGKFQRFT
jgi:hypothetical protein